MDRFFDDELERLGRALIAMGDLVQQQIVRAVRAVAEHDDAGARQVIARDRQVNACDADIDDRCVELIALYQPTAGDLRVITAAMKIATELERVGDRAVDIARLVHDPSWQPDVEPSLDLAPMAECVRRMLDRSLAAFLARDAPLAREVSRDAMQIGALRKRVFGELLAGMLQEASATAQIRRAIRISRCLERIAEGAVAIAAMVVRMVEARDAPLAVR